MQVTFTLDDETETNVDADSRNENSIFHDNFVAHSNWAVMVSFLVL